MGERIMGSRRRVSTKAVGGIFRSPGQFLAMAPVARRVGRGRSAGRLMSSENERKEPRVPGNDDDLLGEALGRFGNREEAPGVGEGLLGDPIAPTRTAGAKAPVASAEPLIAPVKRDSVGGNVRLGRDAPRGAGLKAVVLGAIAGGVVATLVAKLWILPEVVGEIDEKMAALEPEMAQKKPPVTVAEESPVAEEATDREPGEGAVLMAELEAQLGILKVRNRLTDLADRAIVLGERQAYQLLKSALSDEPHEGQRTAVRSELLRVEFFYSSGSRLKGYVLPVGEMFPGEGIEREADLSTEQVIGILKDHNQPWKARARSAWLLGDRPSADVTRALVEAMLAEVNLDVMKECQYSFEERTGFRAGALFDTLGIEGAWKQLQARAAIEE